MFSASNLVKIPEIFISFPLPLCHKRYSLFKFCETEEITQELGFLEAPYTMYVNLCINETKL